MLCSDGASSLDSLLMLILNGVSRFYGGNLKCQIVSRSFGSRRLLTDSLILSS